MKNALKKYCRPAHSAGTAQQLRKVFLQAPRVYSKHGGSGLLNCIRYQSEIVAKKACLFHQCPKKRKKPGAKLRALKNLFDAVRPTAGNISQPSAF
jgi:hypothetical protein